MPPLACVTKGQIIESATTRIDRIAARPNLAINFENGRRK
jgi:hypothetical protein